MNSTFVDKVVAFDGWRIKITICETGNKSQFLFDIMEITNPVTEPKTGFCTTEIEIEKNER